MNTMIVNKTVGLLWWHNMAIAKRMQSKGYFKLHIANLRPNSRLIQIYTVRLRVRG
jgi:hypothetical protein